MAKAAAPPGPPPGTPDPVLGQVLVPPVEPPPIPSTPQPLPEASAEAQPKNAPPAPFVKPPPRDLGVLGRIVVWGFMLVLVGGTTVGWIFGAQMVGALVGDFTNKTGVGYDLAMNGATEDMMAEMAAAMEAAMGFEGLQEGTADPDESTAPAPPAGVQPDPAPERKAPGRSGWGHKAVARDVTWPDLQLNGVLVGSEDWKGSVILDSEMVPLAASIQGMKVVAVEEYGAWFEYAGARKFVSVHERTR